MTLYKISPCLKPCGAFRRTAWSMYPLLTMYIQHLHTKLYSIHILLEPQYNIAFAICWIFKSILWTFGLFQKFINKTCLDELSQKSHNIFIFHNVITSGFNHITLHLKFLCLAYVKFVVKLQSCKSQLSFEWGRLVSCRQMEYLCINIAIKLGRAPNCDFTKKTIYNIIFDVPGGVLFGMAPSFRKKCVRCDSCW